MANLTLELKAPLSGPIVALEDVPDPVFSQKMVGDGISIDPVSESLCAPCDGKVVQLHRAHHAVTIEAAHGIEIMMHIGVDTVGLKGEGFRPSVGVGDTVSQGQPLIDFDADRVATNAKSLLTQIIVANGDLVERMDYGTGTATSGENIVLTLHAREATHSESAGAAQGERVVSEPITIANPTGLHARPSALLVAEAKKFAAAVTLHKSSVTANAKSLVAIMGLEVNCGDVITVEAVGPDATAAINALTAAIRGGLGEHCVSVEALEDVDEEQAAQAPRSEDPSILLGVTASPGLAVGHIFQLEREQLSVPEDANDSDAEQQTLKDALAKAHGQLQDLKSSLEDEEKAAIFAAHQELLEDPELLDQATTQIARGKSAAFAWRASYRAQSDALSKLKNELLAGRANDLRDVGRRVLRLILGIDAGEQDMPGESILIAEDLTPSDTAALDRTKVLGFCTVTGGASSHVAILARSLNLPAIAGIEARALKVATGTRVILDAGEAMLRLDPDDTEIERIENARIALERKRADELANANKPAETTDGRRLEVVANIASAKDASLTTEAGGEGVGLCRTEFLFMSRASAPDEEEQFAIYSDMAASLQKDEPLIIRTLDVGGDKPLPYLPIDAEDNPFLGLRGIRVSLQRPAMFRTQLRAILRAAEASRGKGARIMVMFPMVTTIDDVRQAREILEEEREKLGVEAIPVGIMVEVPATAVMAEQFAREVDFFSIGTNDLGQYVLAIDRGHPQLAAQADGLNPSMLTLIAKTVEGARKHDAWVGVCGGLASDAVAVPLLVGIGVDELSVSLPGIPEIKAAVRSVSHAECQALTEQALQLASASEVRQLVKDRYPGLA
ncbi:MAG: phosphoenolpyruvate--protein phosphotransferase [Pseudomonadota bacterium]